MWHFRHHEDWENEIEGLDAGTAFRKRDFEGVRRVLVENPKHDADEKKSQHQWKDQNCAKSEGLSTVRDGAASEDALNNQLLRPVGGENHDGATDDAHPD